MKESLIKAIVSNIIYIFFIITISIEHSCLLINKFNLFEY